MANLPDYVAMAKPNPLDNRFGWWKNIAPTYIGIMLWFVFWQDIPTAAVGGYAGGMFGCGLGLAILALAIAALLCHFLFYLVPGKLGFQTGLPLYIVGTSTYGVRGGFLMPGFLMGALQFGWLAVNAYFAGMLLGAAAGAAPNTPMHLTISVIFAVVAAFIGLKGIKYVAGISTYLPLIPIVILIILTCKTAGNVSKFDAKKLVETQLAPVAAPAEATPATEAAPAAEATPATEAAPATEATPATEAAPATEGTPATEETAPAEELPASETTADETAPATEAGSETAGVDEAAPVAETAPAEKAAPATEAASETVVADGAAPATVPAPEAAPATEKAAAKAEMPKRHTPFTIFNFMAIYIFGFFATAGAAGCDMGTNSRSNSDVQLGGLFGVFGSTFIAGLLSLLIYAGAYGGGLIPYTEAVGQTPGLMGKIMGSEAVGKTMMTLLAIAAFPSACFATLIAANSFKTTLPKVNPFITCGLGALGAVLLILTTYAGQAGQVFSVIGASFGPVCGAMVADYLLSGGKWNGPRAGFNPAGWLSWVFGFAVGAFNFLPPACRGGFDMPCPPLLAFLVGFILYVLFAKMGLESQTLEYDEKA